ncbi:MAG: hypothetical protein ACFCD0_16750 [Gemmataceae bacterium]
MELKATIPKELGILDTDEKTDTIQNQKSSSEAKLTDTDVLALASEYGVSPEALWQLLTRQSLSRSDPRYWAKESLLRKDLGDHFDILSVHLANIARRSVRASSVVENLRRSSSQLFLFASESESKVSEFASVLSQSQSL